MLSSLVLSLSLLISSAQAADWPDLSTTPAGAVRDGANDVALVIAIGDYLWDSVPDIPGAAENGEAWRRYLKEVRGVGVVKTLTDKEATREDILVEASTLRARVKPGGRFWIVFVGHGAPSPDGRDGLLVAVDAKGEATSLYANSVPQAELLRAAGAEDGVNVLAFVDACFSGSATGSSQRQALAPGLQPLIPTALAEVAAQRSATVLTAASGDQFAGPLPGLGRPAFSWLALGALRGWGDGNGDGQVSAQELTDFVSDRMAEVVRGRRQQPQLLGKGELVLGRGRERAPDLVALTRGSVPAPASAPARAPQASAPQASAPAPAGGAKSTSFGGATLDVSAQLKEQACADEARTKFSQQREQQLAREVARVQTEGRLALKALTPQAEACTKLADKAARQPCLSAIDTWLGSAKGASVELPAASGSVTTACGPRNAADGVRRGSVDLSAEIAGAGELRGRVVAGAAAGGPKEVGVAIARKALPAGKGRKGAATPINFMGYAMVRIEPGTFTMGSPVQEKGRSQDEAEHRVTLTRAFLLGKTEVTQGLWKEVMGENPSYFSACGNECPVEQVSWCEAVFFANRLSELAGLTPAYENTGDCKDVQWVDNADGYRLPTEAEWEYAARAGSSEVFSGGARDDVAWHKGNSGGSPHLVATKGANALGLFDMSGNVWEWTWDLYAEALDDATDPRGHGAPDAAGVVRGGSWRDAARSARVAYRLAYHGNLRSRDVGLRLARTVR